MKNILFLLFTLPLFAIAQEQDPCFSINDVFSQMDEENPPIEINLVLGWNMIGYPCSQEIIVSDAFSFIVEDISIVKDNDGNVYMPEFSFNGIGFLEGGQGYQIKMNDLILGFNFCQTLQFPSINGCTDCQAINFSPIATNDDESCTYESEQIYGCIYLWADNYNPIPTENDESCFRYGCLEVWADNFDPLATNDDESCYKIGCTYDWADNYDAYVTIDDGSCNKIGCSDSLADNFDDLATINDGTCNFSLIGYSLHILSQDDGLDSEHFVSFIDNNSINIITITNNMEYWFDDFEIISFDDFYNPWSLLVSEYGDSYEEPWSIFINDDYASGTLIVEEGYNLLFSIEEIIFGCIDSNASNYNPDANTNSDNCLYFEYGCTDEFACNYNSNSNNDDGSCVYSGELEFIEHASILFSQGTDIFSQGTSIYLQGSNLFTQGTALFLNNSTSFIESIINEIYSLFEIFDSEVIFDCNVCINDINNNDICDELEVSGCIYIEACNFNPNAIENDGSCEYASLGYDCEGNIIEYVVGMVAEGGIVFYLDETGQHGLVAALEDITEGSNMGAWGTSEGFEWGCYGTSVSGADGTEIGTGIQNTLDIVDQNCQTQNGGITAAQATLNYSVEGYTDWCLPSKEELQEMYSTIGNGGSQGNIGGFETNDYPYYWSSSEDNTYGAWLVYSNDSNPYSSNKYNSLRVRCIRAF